MRGPKWWLESHVVLPTQFILFFSRSGRGETGGCMQYGHCMDLVDTGSWQGGAPPGGVDKVMAL
jgi:hypothetical protein